MGFSPPAPISHSVPEPEAFNRDESPDLFAHLRPTVAGPGQPAPVQSKARPMPSDHSLRLHDNQNIRPSRPHAPKSGPEEAVEAVRGRSRTFPFQHGDLLSQREDLKRTIEATSEEHAEGKENGTDQMEHESTL